MQIVKCAQVCSYFFAEKKFLTFFFPEINGNVSFSAKVPQIFSARNGRVFAYNMFEILTKC